MPGVTTNRVVTVSPSWWRAPRYTVPQRRVCRLCLQGQLEAAQKRIHDMAWDSGAQRHGRGDDYSPRKRKGWLACFTA